MNPPQPSDFGIVSSAVDDLRRLEGKAFKFFDAAWHRCKGYSKAWKKFREAEDAYHQAVARSHVQFWCSLSARDFELHSAELLTKLGYAVIHEGGKGDRGIDIRAKDSLGLIVVQCKAYNRRVGPDAVRSLAGVMIASGADRGWLFTTRGGTIAAHEAVRELRFQGNRRMEISIHQANDLALASMDSYSYSYFKGKFETRTMPGRRPSEIPSAS